MRDHLPDPDEYSLEDSEEEGYLQKSCLKFVGPDGDANLIRNGYCVFCSQLWASND
jgi:hypothetical protein